LFYRNGRINPTNTLFVQSINLRGDQGEMSSQSIGENQPDTAEKKSPLEKEKNSDVFNSKVILD
jgi:hypothetical protein